MADERSKALLGKIVLKGTLECVTGLHIGASKESLDIGSIDAPIVRDPLARTPYIPGSSIKGKLRALSERVQGKQFNRYSGQGVHRHECSSTACPVCRLFGSTTSGGGALNLPSRLIVRDCHLTAEAKQRLAQLDTGLQFSEWKFENALDRVSASANPRQLERVPAGAEFEFEIIYNVEVADPDVIEGDLGSLLLAMSLLEDDYLGGHGSRGYGRIQWKPTTVVGRTLKYYSATSVDERSSAEVAFELDSMDACRDKVQEMVLGLLDAEEPKPEAASDTPAEEPPPPAEEPQPPAEGEPAAPEQSEGAES